MSAVYIGQPFRIWCWSRSKFGGGCPSWGQRLGTAEGEGVDPVDHGGSLTCLARFAVGVVRHSAMPGMERVPGCVSSGQGPGGR